MYPTYRKILASLITILILVESCMFASAATSEPIMIYDTDGLKAIANDLSGSYMLGCDIIFEDGETFNSLGSDTDLFKGTLDGNGYTIRNISLTDSENVTTAHVGLFAYNSGTIKNLTLTGVTYKVPKCNYLVAGSFAANQVKTGKIQNCAVYGDVNITDANVKYNLVLGGVVGSFYKGTVDSTVSCLNISYSGNNSCDAGGICSDLGGTVKNSINNGNVSIDSKQGFANVGGIVGRLRGSSTATAKVTNSINNGTVSGASADTLTVGGINGGMYTNTSKGEITGVINTGKTEFESYVNITDISQKFGQGAISGMYLGTSSNNYYLNTSSSVAVEVGSLTATSKTMEELRALPLGDGWYLPNDNTKVKNLTAHKTITDVELLINTFNLPSGKPVLEVGTPFKVKASYDDGTSAQVDNVYTSISCDLVFDGTIEFGTKNAVKTFELTTYKKADLNRDNYITVGDATVLRSRILDDNANELEFISGDINDDKELTVTDLLSEINIIINN